MPVFVPAEDFLFLVTQSPFFSPGSEGKKKSSQKKNSTKQKSQIKYIDKNYPFFWDGGLAGYSCIFTAKIKSRGFFSSQLYRYTSEKNILIIIIYGSNFI